MTAIQKAEPQALVQTDAEWTRERLDLVKQQICPSGITDGEFALFIEGCKRRGLDPLRSEAYCVPRTVSGKKVNVLQVSVEGMRTRAMRFGDLLSYAKDAVYEKDTCIIDRQAGTVAHRYDSSKERGMLKSAWARVVRRGMEPFIISLPAGSRAPGAAYNAAAAGEHLAKCAAAAALRDAYPDTFSGVYTGEEIPAEREPSRLEAALSGEAKGSVTVLPPEPGPVVIFGEWKLRPISALTTEEAHAAIRFADAKLKDAPAKAKWRGEVEANRMELAAAYGEPMPEASPEKEPGSAEPSLEEQADILRREHESAQQGEQR